MMKGGIGNMMKQVQLMQQNMQKAQEQLAETEVEGVAGAGMVKVTMTCRNDVRPKWRALPAPAWSRSP